MLTLSTMGKKIYRGGGGSGSWFKAITTKVEGLQSLTTFLIDAVG
jgi:hypothetical protein